MNNSNEQNQSNSFKPAALAEPSLIQDKCIFVIHEVGKYEASKEFYKLGASYDGASWLVPLTHKKAVEEICKKYNLTHFEIPLPASFEELKKNNDAVLLQDKLIEVENQVRILTANIGIDWILIDDLASEENINKLKTSSDGLKVVRLLNEHQKNREKLGWLDLKVSSSTNLDTTLNRGACVSTTEVLKTSKIIDAIQNKMSQYKNTGKVSLSGIATKYEKLDDLIDGLQAEHFIVLAGRTGMGKSWAAFNLIKNIAIEQKINTALFSLEMSNAEVLNRLIPMCSGVPSKKIKHGTICIEEFEEVIKAIGTISDTPLLLSDEPSNSQISLLVSNIEKACEQGAKIVFIDHIGLVKKYNDSNNNRANEMGEITRAIKMTAKKCKVPIICMAQLNRNADNYEIPKLSHLRESGALEQDSDIVLFVNRADYYKSEEHSGEFELIIGKNRHGEQGTIIPFKYDKNTWLLEESSEPYTNRASEAQDNPAVSPRLSKKAPVTSWK